MSARPVTRFKLRQKVLRAVTVRVGHGKIRKFNSGLRDGTDWTRKLSQIQIAAGGWALVKRPNML